MNEPVEVNPVVAVAKERMNGDFQPVTLSTGYRAIIRPVSASLLSEVTGRIKDPPVPEVFIEENGRSEPNPNDPLYLKALEEAERSRTMAGMDAMILFGVELVDPPPQDDKWLKKLQYMEKNRLLDLSSFDLTNPVDREFLFMRFIAVSSADLETISEASGMSSAEVEARVRSFQGNA